MKRTGRHVLLFLLILANKTFADATFYLSATMGVLMPRSYYY
jgi:hypothetical protein